MSSHGGSSGGAAPATTVTGPDIFGASAAVGTGTHYARNDHDHGLPAAPAAVSGLLARVQYGPAVLVTYNLTSVTLAVVDATNLTISFTAPASGDVLVRLSTCAQLTGAVASLFYAVLDHTTHSQYGYTVCGGVGAGLNVFFPASCPILVTGLTPATVYQVDWAYALTGASPIGTIYFQGTQGVPAGNGYTPATMEVWAA